MHEDIVTPQERAEWEYKTKVGVAEAFAGVTLPKVIMTGGNGNSNSAMDALGLRMMWQMMNELSK